MVHLERKEWLWGWWRLFTNWNILFFVNKKTQGKWQEHRENSGKTQGIWYQLERGNPELSWFLDLEIFFEINRAWLHKDLKIWRLLANRKLAQTVACRAWKSEVLGSIPSGGNILLLFFFFLFSRNSVEFYRMQLHLGKTWLTSMVNLSCVHCVNMNTSMVNVYSRLVWHTVCMMHIFKWKKIDLQHGL